MRHILTSRHFYMKCNCKTLSIIIFLSPSADKNAKYVVLCNDTKRKPHYFSLQSVTTPAVQLQNQFRVQTNIQFDKCMIILKWIHRMDYLCVWLTAREKKPAVLFKDEWLTWNCWNANKANKYEHVFYSLQNTIHT